MQATARASGCPAAYFNYCRGKPKAPIRQLLATAAAAVPRAASRGASVALALARSLALAPLHELAIAFNPVPTATSATSGAPAGAGSLRHINNAKQCEVVKWYHQTRTAYNCDRHYSIVAVRQHEPRSRKTTSTAYRWRCIFIVVFR